MRTFSLQALAPLALLASIMGSATAQNLDTVRVHIPFSFVLGQSAMPAGDYTVQRDDINSTITVQGRSSVITAVMMTTPVGPARGKGTPKLTFKRVNGQPALTEMQLGGQVLHVLQHPLLAVSNTPLNP